MGAMNATVDFYFDVVCPYAYLAHGQIEGLCERHGATLRWRPILLGGLFRTVGAGDGPMPAMAASKARLNELDMRRWADLWRVPFTMPAGHPNRTVLAMRCVLASDDVPRAAKALFAAYWGEGRDCSKPEVVRQALDGAGLNGVALLAAAERPATKQALRDAVDEAAAVGAFGVPTFLVRRPDGEPALVWGQDRLDFVGAAIDGTLAP